MSVKATGKLLLLFVVLVAAQAKLWSPVRNLQRLRLRRYTSLPCTANDNQSDAFNDNSTGDSARSRLDAPDAKTFVFGKDGEFKNDMKKLGIDPVRFVAYNALAVVLALGADFLGVTSNLMSNSNPEFFRSARFDQLYSIQGFRRHVDQEDKYEYRFPSTWLVDQSVALAEARERELPKAIREKKQALALRPDSAYGPMGSDGRDNVSVVKSRVMPGFTLKGTLGEPREAAERLLENVIAPPGSGKVYKLIDAYADDRDGAPAYVFEYTVQKEGTTDSNGVVKGGFYQHSLSVVTSRGTELFTLTAVSPEGRWEQQKNVLNEVARSFRIESSNLPAGFY